MNLDYILYAALAISLAVFIARKIQESKKASIEEAVIEDLKHIAESMRSGNSFESAIVAESQKSSASSCFFKKVLKESENSSIDEALIDAAQKFKNKTLEYVSEVISLTITSKGNTISSLNRISQNLWEISHLEKRVDEKASSALTTLHVMGLVVMPGIFYFLAAVLSFDDMVIAVDFPMKIYLGMLMLVFCFMDFIVFKDLKESLFMLPVGISIYLLYIYKLGPLIASLFGVI